MLYNQSSKLFHPAKLKLGIHSTTIHLPSHQLLATTILLSVSMNLTILDTPYKWSLTVFASSPFKITFSFAFYNIRWFPSASSTLSFQSSPSFSGTSLPCDSLGFLSQDFASSCRKPWYEVGS